jgi:antitoxin (DNA-binding transcriptional repressor) of toxin-antitoxin stability system
MKIVNTHDAKTHLSKILSEVEKGEVYILARAGKAIAQLSPYRRPVVDLKPGKWSGHVVVRSDFDAEDESINAAFEGRGQ